MASVVKYRCEICDLGGIKARADWLFHMSMDRHHVKARENLQDVYLESNGNIFVVSGYDIGDEGVLLDYIGSSLTTLTNFISFKPQANICWIVCDPREFEKFEKIAHYVGEERRRLNCRRYKDIQPAEWMRLVGGNKAIEDNNQGEKSSAAAAPPFKPLQIDVKRDDDEYDSSSSSAISEPSFRPLHIDVKKDDDYEFDSCSSSASSEPSFRPLHIDVKRDDDDSDSSSSKSYKDPTTSEVAAKDNQLYPKRDVGHDHSDVPSTSSQMQVDPVSGNDFGTDQISHSQQIQNSCTTSPAIIDVWKAEINQILDVFIMAEDAKLLRVTAIAELKNLIRRTFSNAELIAVGPDFLGFNIKCDRFQMYLDDRGLLQPPSAPYDRFQIATVIDRSSYVMEAVVHLLRTSEIKGSLKEIGPTANNSIQFIYIGYGLIPLECEIFLAPFSLGVTALLCKELFFFNEETSSLVTMVVYWCSRNETLSNSLCKNPYVIYWLVYFFLIRKQMLPPVIELQMSCDHQVLDRGMNVAFSYNPDLLDKVASKFDVSNVQAKLGLLLDWFKFMMETFENLHRPGPKNRRHSLICPRLGDLIDKRYFKVCKKKFFKKTNSKKHKKRMKAGEVYSSNLIRAGFETSTWSHLGSLNIPHEILCIQHPFYISDNISFDFRGTFAKLFFEKAGRTIRLLSTASTSNSLDECSLLTAFD